MWFELDGQCGSAGAMIRQSLKHFLAFLIAINLIGGGVFPYAAFARAHETAASNQSGGMDGMAMDSSARADQPVPCESMPCNSAPCKGIPADCMQACLLYCTPLGISASDFVPAIYPLRHVEIPWPPDGARTDLSVKPDPFPPKSLNS